MKKPLIALIALFALLSLAATLSAQLIISTETPVVVPGPTPVPQETTTPVLQTFFYSYPRAQVRIDIGAGTENYTSAEFAAAAAVVGIDLNLLASQLSAARNEMIRARAVAPSTP